MKQIYSIGRIISLPEIHFFVRCSYVLLLRATAPLFAAVRVRLYGAACTPFLPVLPHTARAAAAYHKRNTNTRLFTFFIGLVLKPRRNLSDKCFSCWLGDALALFTNLVTGAIHSCPVQCAAHWRESVCLSFCSCSSTEGNTASVLKICQNGAPPNIFLLVRLWEYTLKIGLRRPHIQLRTWTLDSSVTYSNTTPLLF